MKKRGAGNVEFILAFVLFISFTAAALYFLNPIRDVRSMQSSLNYVVGAITSNTSVQLDLYSIVITAPKAEQSIKIAIPGIQPNENVRATDYYGKKMSSIRNGENFSILYLSEDISGETGACTGPINYYKIASFTQEKIISEKRFLKLNE